MKLNANISLVTFNWFLTVFTDAMPTEVGGWERGIGVGERGIGVGERGIWGWGEGGWG